MTRMRFSLDGEVVVDAYRLGLAAAESVMADESLEAKDYVMKVRLDPTQALGVWIHDVLNEQFREKLGGAGAQLILGQVQAVVMEEPGE